MVRFSDLKNQRAKAFTEFSKTIGIELNQEIQVVQTTLANYGVRVGEDEINEYLKTHGSNSTEVVEYFTDLYKSYGKVGINRFQKETTFAKSNATQSSKVSKPKKANALNIEYTSFRDKAGKAFYDYVIKTSYDREEETIQVMRKSNSINIQSGKDVLNFFNGSYKTTINDEIIKYENDVDFLQATKAVQSALTGNRGSSKQNKDPISDFISSSDLVEYDTIIEMLNSGIIYAPGVIGYIKTMDRAKTKKKYAEKSSQLQKGSKTIVEHIARSMLDKKSAYFNNNPTLVGVGTARSVGSAPSDNFTKYLLKEKSTLEELTPDDINNAADEYAKTIAEDIVGLAFAQKYLYLGGQKKDTTSTNTVEEALKKLKVADLMFQVAGRNVYIDAKFGLARYDEKLNPNKSGGRYTPSGGITTTIKDINSGFFDISMSKEFLDKIDNAINYFYSMIASGIVTEASFQEKTLNYFITYAILSSNQFLNHYRVSLKLDNSKFNFTQPDFLLTQTGYCWYSDFFRVVHNIYFKDENRGDLASLDIKKFYNVKFMDEYKKNNSKREYVDQMLEFVKDVNPEDAKKIAEFKNIFLGSQVSFKMGIDKFKQELNKVVEKGGSHR